MHRRPTLTENKLMLLHIARRLGPVTNQQALRFVVENDVMDYIDLQLSLAELTEGGLLVRYAGEEGRLYELSRRGREALEMFSGQVPASRMRAIDRVAEPWRRRFQRERQLSCQVEKSDTGEYQARMRVLEHGCTLMELTLTVPERAQAQALCRAFERQAEELYAGLIGALAGQEP